MPSDPGKNFLATGIAPTLSDSNSKKEDSVAELGYNQRHAAHSSAVQADRL